jgi:dihydrofolate reductase
MGRLTFSINLTLDGCLGHTEGIADDETLALFTGMLRDCGAMLWGRVTYEMMEAAWPPIAAGVQEAAPSEYVVSSTRTDFPWTNTHLLAGDLRTAVQGLKDATPAGVLVGSGTLAVALDRLDLIDEYRFLVHPRIAGHGPALFGDGLPRTRRLELVSTRPLANGVVDVHYRRAD